MNVPSLSPRVDRRKQHEVCSCFRCVALTRNSYRACPRSFVSLLSRCKRQIFIDLKASIDNTMQSHHTSPGISSAGIPIFLCSVSLQNFSHTAKVLSNQGLWPALVCVQANEHQQPCVGPNQSSKLLDATPGTKPRLAACKANKGCKGTHQNHLERHWIRKFRKFRKLRRIRESLEAHD